MTLPYLKEGPLLQFPWSGLPVHPWSIAASLVLFDESGCIEPSLIARTVDCVARIYWAAFWQIICFVSREPGQILIRLGQLLMHTDNPAMQQRSESSQSWSWPVPSGSHYLQKASCQAHSSLA